MDLDHTRRRAQWEVTVGQLTVAATLAARLMTVYWQLTANGPLDPVLFVQAVFKSGLLIAILLLYRRFAWPSLLLVAVWPIGFLYAWLGPPHATPRILAVGLVIGFCFLVGAHGVRTLRGLRALENSSAFAG